MKSSERWFPRIATVAAVFTAACCLGLSAAVSIASAVGAGFMLDDDSLRPLLAITLGVTVVASFLTFRRHHRPIPMIITIVMGVVVYVLIFGGASSEAEPAHGGHGGGTERAETGPLRLGLAWTAVGVLVGAQVWDVSSVRRCEIGERSPSRR